MGPHVTEKSHKGHNDLNKSAPYRIGNDFLSILHPIENQNPEYIKN